MKLFNSIVISHSHSHLKVKPRPQALLQLFNTAVCRGTLKKYWEWALWWGYKFSVLLTIKHTITVPIFMALLFHYFPQKCVWFMHGIAMTACHMQKEEKGRLCLCTELASSCPPTPHKEGENELCVHMVWGFCPPTNPSCSGCHVSREGKWLRGQLFRCSKIKEVLKEIRKPSNLQFGKGSHHNRMCVHTVLLYVKYVGAPDSPFP